MMVFNWLVAIKTAEAEMKPEITGWLKKLAKNPSFKIPMTMSMQPDMNAKVMATAQ